MFKIVRGLLCDAIFGAISVATMIPLKMERKQIAMLGAFANRFGIDFVICNSTLPVS